MIDKLKQFFATASAESSPSQHQLAVAATALMVQVARADRQQDDRELQAMLDSAIKAHEVSPKEAQDILDDALAQADDATSLYQFTGLINAQLDQVAKQALLQSIWLVAFADGHIDHYEEHLIRRMADLLHLNHREYIQAKHNAEQAHAARG
ncbi:tellurite resistance TerB family protein [Marinobacter sp. SS21]|uniref:tellurite resistance TerB family protein n=1 Tax=Marinobacter sp. SS21 TaxID=2979460 RepID=UPI00232EC9CA|nr:TerB family tellurite resistance protein [Marinobacter sp. SS21]MDC0662094.1 TerB family tellurite resistance protein [Marinobacter sp. SS21]